MPLALLHFYHPVPPKYPLPLPLPFPLQFPLTPSP